MSFRVSTSPIFTPRYWTSEVLFLQSLGILKINRYGRPGENVCRWQTYQAHKSAAAIGMSHRNQLKRLFPIFAFGSVRVSSFIMFFLFRRIPEQARIKTERRQQGQHDAGREGKNAAARMHRGDFAQFDHGDANREQKNLQACSRDQ